jgi:hypothetical protein
MRDLTRIRPRRFHQRTAPPRPAIACVHEHARRRVLAFDIGSLNSSTHQYNLQHALESPQLAVGTVRSDDPFCSSGHTSDNTFGWAAWAERHSAAADRLKRTRRSKNVYTIVAWRSRGRDRLTRAWLCLQSGGLLVWHFHGGGIPRFAPQISTFRSGRQGTNLAFANKP